MIKPEKSNFYKGLKIWRKKRGLTQLQLATRAGICGYAYSRLERGAYQWGPNLAIAVALAKALDVTLLDLLAEE